MIQKNEASALLMVLSMIIVLLTASYQIWQILSLRIDVEQQRELYYKRFYLVDDVLNGAVLLAIKNFDQIFKAKTAVKFDFVEQGKMAKLTAFAQADVVVKKGKPKPNILVVSAYLFKSKQCIFSVKCLLNRVNSGTKNNFVVSNYSVV